MSSIDSLATFPKAAKEAAGPLCTRAQHWLMFNSMLTTTPKILFRKTVAPACTGVEVYCSLDFGLCNTSQKNRKITFRAMLTQMYIAMHPWAPHTVLFHAKKSHCQHIYQTVREILPVLVSVCQVHTLCKHIKCLRICKDIYKSVCTVVQTCILKYSSELSFCWHPRPSGLHV